MDFAHRLLDVFGPVAALDPSLLAPYLAQAQARASRVDTVDGIPLYTIEGDGVAVVDIVGALSREVLAWRGMVWLDGYDRITQAILEADKDPAVRARALRIDSPGGVAAGIWESMAQVLGAEARTPILAYADERAASAAIAWALVAEEVYLPRSGEVGSIGTIALHADLSRALDMSGIKYTAIVDPKGKAEGWPYWPLSDEAKAAMQERVSSLTDLFVEHVAARRDMTPEAVRALNARMFSGQKAVEAGLADGVMSWSQVVARAEVLGRQREQERMKSVYALLGLPATASAEDVDKAAAAAAPVLELGRAALKETGETDPQAANGALKAMAKDARETSTLRASLEANAAKADQEERIALLVALAQVEPPSHVWQDGDKAKGPVLELAEMKTPALRAYVERRTKSPKPAATQQLSSGNGAASREPTDEEVKAHMRRENIKNEGVARADLRRTYAEGNG